MSTNGKGRMQANIRHIDREHRPCLVGGGAGFLGRHLCERLLKGGRRVICIDNFCTSEVDGVDHLREHPGFELLRGDIALLTEDALDPVGEVFNLACAASPVHYQKSPLSTLFTSVRGTDVLLRIARLHGTRMFQASTSEVYGHPSTHPQTEEYWGYVNPMGPRACYDEGKRCAETLCFIYREQYDVPVRVGRIFNTYGPGMRITDGRVVINFIVQALGSEPITVYGDGRQTRSFCYVDDLMDGILRLMAPENEFAGPVNFGNPVEIEVGELAERIVELTGSHSRIILRPLPIDDPPRRRPDITLAQRKLGWKPVTDLDEGLALTIQDVERRLQKGDPSLTLTSRPARPGLAGASPL